LKVDLKKLLFLPFILFAHNLMGQFFLYNTNEQKKIDLHFVKHSVEATKGKTIFNVVKVVNKSSQPQTFTFQLTVPSGWKILGEEKLELTLPPLDSTLIPIRVAIGKNVRGDIGYSIIAAIIDQRGNVIKNEYSFVKVPREIDIKVKFLTRFEYFDQQTGHAPVKVKIENRGNREELITLSLDAGNFIGIGTARLQNFILDVNIPPYSDSTVVFEVYLNKQLQTSRDLFKLNLQAKTIDSTFKSTSWLKNLSSKYTNYIPDSRRVLITEFFARGLFSNYAKPAYASIIQGNILLRKKNEIYFFYNNYNTTPTENLYRFNRMWIGYNANKYFLQLGDINRSIESSLYGRGGNVGIKMKKIKFEAIATQRVLNPQNNFGTELEFSPTQDYGFKLGGVFTKSINENFESKLGTVGFKLNLIKKLRLGYSMVYNQIQFGNQNDSIFNKIAFGSTAFLNYSGRKLNATVRFKFGQPFLNSSFNGRSELISQVVYNLNEKNIIQHYTIDNRINPGDYRSFNIITQPFTNFHKQFITWGYYPNNKVHFFSGPGFEINSSDIFPVIRRGLDYFSTLVYNYNLGFRFKGEKPSSSLTAQIFTGFVNVLHKPIYFIDSTFSIPTSKSRFNYQNISINLRQPRWGLQAMYTNGPRSIYEQFNWYYGSRPNRMLRVMPYFDSFIYKEQLRLQVNVSYSNDLVAKSSYSNITSQLFWYLPKDWQLRFLNVYTIQSRVTPTEAVERFQNMYFEASVRKEFGIQQPYLKFHTLKLVFFKDFNGNRIMNENEPGIKNVLVNIQRIDDEKMDYPDFTSGELLSNQYGEVIYEKIPAGIYELSYNAVGNETGTFSKADIDIKFSLNKNLTLYIPFVEKNKIFGRIILNRSKLSGLGKVDVSNIRITATDTRGNTISTLTDKNGEFVIYAPVTDEYVVTVNNIFYQDFDLRQNNFRVQFNGYKQFEVNFVFDEKVRRINFSPSSQDLANESVLQVRRTNLRGTIKDASSLKPLRARVNLINTKNNSIVASIYSNPLTGDYNLSFLAGENYALEVVADDYWYYSETLNLNQVTTFMNVTRDILLKPISIGSKLELNIRFEINKADLGPEAVAELNRLLDILRQNPGIKIEVQGHSDDLEAINNQTISEERAKRVAQYLIENGFSNLQVRGFGNTVPIAPNDTEENRALNRRVEIEVIGK
jgi:outer membrane protein OmpA-like peptidoglycan-associated protein